MPSSGSHSPGCCLPWSIRHELPRSHRGRARCRHGRARSGSVFRRPAEAPPPLPSAPGARPLAHRLHAGPSAPVPTPRRAPAKCRAPPCRHRPPRPPHTTKPITSPASGCGLVHRTVCSVFAASRRLLDPRLCSAAKPSKPFSFTLKTILFSVCFQPLGAFCRTSSWCPTATLESGIDNDPEKKRPTLARQAKRTRLR